MSCQCLTATVRSAAHLTPQRWAEVNAALVAKIIGEFAHEGLFEPRCLDQTVADATQPVCYEIHNDTGRVRYRFTARRFWLYHWQVEPATIEREVDGQAALVDAGALFVDFKTVLGLTGERLALYLQEIASTRYSAAYKRSAARLSAAELARADFQTVESAMTEGHPAFVANNGRIGFDGDDFAAYAPEAAHPIRLIWVAAHRSRAEFSVAADRSVASHLADELDASTRQRFADQLIELGLAPADYHFLPVHPWQWQNKLVFAYADEIATRHLVHLGFAPNAYQAQQSIRTLFNHDAPTRCYVKTSLSILNMGFARGLSPYYMAGTPAICDWLAELIDGDAYLAERGFSILREVAAIGYRHPQFEAGLARTDGANKMLSALWRESPVERIGEGERLMTMAALLHRDYAGDSVIGALIEASGLSTEAWLDRYLDAYFGPILHCFYAHDLVFMPHGENLILVLREHAVDRVIMKDIAEEIAVMDPQAELPEAVSRIAVPVPDELRTLSIFTDLFDLIFRYIAPILAVERDYPQSVFWQRVAACIERYQQAHPEYGDKFEAYDLFAPDFRRSCLNRLQLANSRQMLDLADPTASLQFVGWLTNPVARVDSWPATPVDP
ncbi:IucA/IucC family siderophore biosynthesis protein [Salinisphaera sp. SPP-AMP-43]|uniref:IucA/IucC family protein n=1 Tax=Salinisphaera sp. SPP-AMP-43 TaxID=3121288 RepID=UPI003C6E8E4D